MRDKLVHLTTIVLFALLFFFTAALSAQGVGSPNVTFLANVNQYPSQGYNDCWGYTAPDNREYALLGVESGVSIIDITDAANPQEVAFIASSVILWKDIKTYQHYAYVVTDVIGSGLQIIDLSNLPNSAVLVNTFNGINTMHNVFVDELNGILYASPGSGNNPCRVFSLADPVNPVEISSFGVHNHDSYVTSNRAFLAEGFSGSLGIFDVSDPVNPFLLGRVGIPASGYVHNAWATPDGNYVLTTEETGGHTIKYWDVQDPGNPIFLSDYLAPDGLAHNAHIKGDFAYISHYGDGLRIVDLSNPNAITEIGYYDTFQGPGGNFVGAWGAYPFFRSGKVLISDMSTGLYIVYFAGADETLTGIDDEEPLAQDFYAAPNYPNPFNPSTTIEYRLPVGSPVQISVYNTLGQKIRSLQSGQQSAGSHQVQWDGRDDAGAVVSGGIYIVNLRAGKFQHSQKVVFSK